MRCRQHSLFSKLCGQFELCSCESGQKNGISGTGKLGRNFFMSLGKQCFALKSGEVCSGKSIERRSAFSTCVSLRGGILADSHLLGAPFSLRWTWGGNSRVLCAALSQNCRQNQQMSCPCFLLPKPLCTRV